MLQLVFTSFYFTDHFFIQGFPWSMAVVVWYCVLVLGIVAWWCNG